MTCEFLETILSFTLDGLMKILDLGTWDRFQSHPHLSHVFIDTSTGWAREDQGGIAWASCMEETSVGMLSDAWRTPGGQLLAYRLDAYRLRYCT